MHWSWPRFAVTLLVALLCALVYHFVVARRLERTEEVRERVVEESHDESAKLQALLDDHDASLRDRDATIARMRADHGNDLDTLRRAHQSETETARAENVRLRELVSELEGATEKARTLQGQLNQQKDEFNRLELDWKKRMDDTTKRVADLEAGHAALAADWNAKIIASEARAAAARTELETLKAEQARSLASRAATQRELGPDA